MQLTIIGAGAIGGTIGAHLIRSGHDVLFCDTDQAHVDAINRAGLAISGPVENFTVAARAVTPDGLPATLGRAAIAVKSHHTVPAAELLRGRLDPQGYVVSFQNGLTSDAITAVTGPGRLVASFVNFGADLLAPGRILQGNIGTFRVGEPGGGPVTRRVAELAAALPYARATDNIMGFLWGKEAYGAMLFAGAVSDLSIAETLEDPRWRPLMLAIAREVLAQAPVPPEGFDGFEPADLAGSLDRLAAFNRASAKSHSGIYRDLVVRRRKTEVDELARLRGPLTGYVAELIRAIERGERACEVANLELLAAREAATRGPRG
jgi:2-dehydropantoate 2-reductase